MANSRQSISFKKRNEADEVYKFPLHEIDATLHTKNSTVMVEYQDDDTAMIIAGNIPGMIRYFDNYDSVDEDEEKRQEYEFSRELLDEALNRLSEYNPETSTSKTNSGNKHMEDIYVEVSQDKRDEVIMKMWQMLNSMKTKYIDFLKEHKPEDYVDHPKLEEEVLEITKTGI